ncbi:MAG: glycosyltransferase family 4 protein [Lachnospiraceae bacterium]|nr:glycosyltransferase family 4 protein [Lachnospiraceae bacterium]
MKILIISHEYPPIGGGGANACFFLTREFAKKGHQVTVITAQFENLAHCEATGEGARIIRVPCRRGNKEKSSFSEMLSYLLSAWRRADALLKKEKYDICLTFFGIPSGPLALHLKRKYQLPYVVRFGGGDIPGAQKRFKYLYAMLAPVVRAIWKNASHLIANSEGLKKRALAFEDRYAVDIIENGVDNLFFVPDGREKEAEAVVILFVSRLIEGKGLQYLIPELPGIQESVRQKTGRGVRLVIVGDGPYRTALEELTAGAGARELVRFEGRKDKEQVQRYYQAADLFVLPSLSEGMPNVVLEAMASGLPIIMTPCEGSKELVTDNGIIASLKNLPEALIRVCADERERRAMGQNSLRRVESHFRWESIGDRYLSVLEDSIGE